VLLAASAEHTCHSIRQPAGAEDSERLCACSTACMCRYHLPTVVLNFLLLLLSFVPAVNSPRSWSTSNSRHRWQSCRRRQQTGSESWRWHKLQQLVARVVQAVDQPLDQALEGLLHLC
jgi:hypothetical protein